MAPLCKNPVCGLRHPAVMNCARAAYEARVNEQAISVPVVVQSGSPEATLVVQKSRHGVYKDAEARKAYKREWSKRKYQGSH